MSDDLHLHDLHDLGFSDRVLPPSGMPFRVTRAERTAVRVFGCDDLVPHGPYLAATPTTGDWVVVEQGQVTAVLPRRTEVVRTTASAESLGQVLAANVDVVGVTVAIHPTPDLGRIERLLALAWSSGATPLVILTKSDLVDDVAGVRAEVAAAALGVEVVVVHTGDLSELYPHLGPGRTIALLGSSGAGKSSLGNGLLESEQLATSEVNLTHGKGRHTTAWRELVLLPHGRGLLLDTPGMRSIGLSGAETDGLDQVFADIEELTQECRFHDCAHDTEPGCAVTAAIEAGALDPRRLRSYRKLLREQAYAERRGNARLEAEAQAAWRKQVAKERARLDR